LTELDLGERTVKPDISWVSSFRKLRRFTLQRGGVTDLSPLSGLTELTSLVLNANMIKDVQPLAGLTHLERLSLSGNQILDASPLAGLVDTEMDLSGQVVKLPGTATGIAEPLTVLDRQGNALALRTPVGATHDGHAVVYAKTGTFTSSWSSGVFSGKVTQAAASTGRIAGSRPTILGTDFLGNAYFESTITADPGSWSRGVRLSYQWTCNGKDIKGATHVDYRINHARNFCGLRVRVTGRAAGVKSVSYTSPRAEVYFGSLLPNHQPDIAGSVRVGSRLHVALPAYLIAPSYYRYLWYANGNAIKGATKLTFTPTRATLGKRISLRLVACRSGFHCSTLYSFATEPVVG
jgi:hypothetical protein